MDEHLAIPQQAVDPEAMERLLIGGDLAGLNAKQRADYYGAVCKSLGLNPLTKPFEYLNLNGKLRLYALRDCADQLRRLHGISIYIANREKMADIYIVTARAKDRSGREDESTGAVTVGNLKGDALANALMKAETKAKRRVTLSIAGLGWLDETELETIPRQGGRALPLQEGEGSQDPADHHPTADQVNSLIELAGSTGDDIGKFGLFVRGMFEWGEDVKITRKYLREHLTLEDYDQLWQYYTKILKEQVEEDVPNFPPQGDTTEGEVIPEQGPEGDRAATGTPGPLISEPISIWARPDEVDELGKMARQAGPKYFSDVEKLVKGHQAGRIPRSRYQDMRELVTKALQAQGVEA